MDFVADALFDGRKLRMLTVVDLFMRECLAIEVDQSLEGEAVVRVLGHIYEQRGQPAMIKADDGSGFTSKAMDEWTYEPGVEADFSHPDRPTDDAPVDSLNRTLHDECLNVH